MKHIKRFLAYIRHSQSGKEWSNLQAKELVEFLEGKALQLMASYSGDGRSR